MAERSNRLWRRLGAPRLGASWLDVKLGLRMLVRHPGLTIVTVFALSIGIPVSLIPIHVLNAIAAPLPFDGADRIIGIRNRNIAQGGAQPRALHDFYAWREELTTVQALAAARSDPYNVLSEDGRAAPIRGSEITASAFEILRVQPHMGRVLLPSDEVPGAPDVVVLGYPQWSPDRTTILYKHWVASSQAWVIATVRWDGDGTALLRSGIHPSWSPDGRRIVFMRDEGMDTHIWVVGADGGVTRHV